MSEKLKTELLKYVEHIVIIIYKSVWPLRNITQKCLGCEVFTTVSSTVKQDHLLSLFPKLKKENIGHSRSVAFVNTVISGTGGKGVDVALNSLAGMYL